MLLLYFSNQSLHCFVGRSVQTKECWQLDSKTTYTKWQFFFCPSFQTCCFTFFFNFAFSSKPTSMSIVIVSCYKRTSKCQNSTWSHLRVYSKIKNCCFNGQVKCCQLESSNSTIDFIPSTLKKPYIGGCDTPCLKK